MIVDDVVPYLLRAGVLSLGDVVDGDIVVEDLSRRNRNVRIGINSRRGLLLKQSDPSDATTRESIRNEASTYRFLHGLGSPEVRRVVPGVVHYDTERATIALEFIPATESLGRYLDDRWNLAQVAVAGQLGRLVAQLQDVRPSTSIDRSRPTIPWALRFAFPGPDLLRIATPGQLAVVRTVQDHSIAWQALRQARNEYRSQCLVHGDLRWDNVLVRAGRNSRLRLWLIDWELAGIGEFAWDVGTIVAAFLARCLCLMDPGDRIGPKTLQQAFVKRLPIAQLEIGAFLHGYGRAANGARVTAEFLRKVAGAAGARLLQTAFEWSPGIDLTPIAGCFLQLGLNMIARPQEAVESVFGCATRA